MYNDDDVLRTIKKAEGVVGALYGVQALNETRERE